MNLSLKKLRNIAIGLSLLVIVFGGGYRLGEKGTSISIDQQQRKVVVNTSPPAERADIDFSLFWDVWSRLEQSYIDKADLDPEEMVDGAIRGMVSALGDPYTVYLPPKENQEFKDDLGGTLEGIGAQLGMRDGRVVVIAPLKKTPAERAGIRAGDIIVKVNDEETTGWSVPEAVTKIRGPKGSTVRLGVFHEGASEEAEIAIVRDTIVVPSVELTIKEAAGSGKKVAHMRLMRFGDQTNKQWDESVAQVLADPSIFGIVLDVRNNPGGYLQGAIYIASEFLANGVVVQQENFDGTRETFSVMRAGRLLTKPVVVLINKGSASASEILAGALRDHERATIVGEKSFGKGSIQTPEDLPGGSGLHITTAKWLLPKGDWIHKEGLTPEVEVENDLSDPVADAQLEKAMEIVLTGGNIGSSKQIKNLK